MEMFVYKVSITSDGESLLSATAEWAAEVKGCSYPIIETVPRGNSFEQVSNYMVKVVKGFWVMPRRSPKYLH